MAQYPDEKTSELPTLTQHEPREPGDRDILAGPSVDAQDHVANRLGLVLDELLVEKNRLTEPGVQFSFSDLLLHIDRFFAHLRHIDPFLFVDGLGRDIFPADKLR